MKLIILFLSVLLAFASCTTPGPITANPDDATSTPGTMGSSKMTNEMPRRPTPDSPQRQDTASRKRDSLP